MPHYCISRSIVSAAVWGVLITGIYGMAANAAPAPAEIASTGAISSIRIEGNQRVENSTIISYLGIKPGNKLDQESIDNSLKNLYGTGFFSDVKLLKSGNTLVVRVVENPIINKVAFEGNSHIETADLEKEMELKTRSVYTQDKLQSDVKRILDIYRRSGRYNTIVEPKIIAEDQNRVDLVYEINEGATAHV